MSSPVFFSYISDTTTKSFNNSWKWNTLFKCDPENKKLKYKRKLCLSFIVYKFWIELMWNAELLANFIGIDNGNWISRN